MFETHQKQDWVPLLKKKKQTECHTLWVAHIRNTTERPHFVKKKIGVTSSGSKFARPMAGAVTKKIKYGCCPGCGTPFQIVAQALPGFVPESKLGQEGTVRNLLMCLSRLMYVCVFIKNGVCSYVHVYV